MAPYLSLIIVLLWYATLPTIFGLDGEVGKQLPRALLDCQNTATAPTQETTTTQPTTTTSASSSGPNSGSGPATAGTIIWRDEFLVNNGEGFFNGGIDSRYWTIDYGDGSDGYIKGWGNNEKECYTDSRENLRVDANPEGGKGDGVLVLQATYKAGEATCINKRAASTTSGSGQIYSGKLKTMRKKTFKWAGTAGASRPIFIEARIKLPLGAQTWPAFWMLSDPPAGDDYSSGKGVYGIWCSSGEIDIMEHVNANNVYTQHVIYRNGGNCGTPDHSTSLGLVNDWHRYGLEWDSTYMKFYFDGKPTGYTVTNSQWNADLRADGPSAPFDQPFHLIFNQAVGGTYPEGAGNPAINYGAFNPGDYKMLVDWVRVTQL